MGESSPRSLEDLIQSMEGYPLAGVLKNPLRRWRIAAKVEDAAAARGIDIQLKGALLWLGRADIHAAITSSSDGTAEFVRSTARWVSANPTSVSDNEAETIAVLLLESAYAGPLPMRRVSADAHAPADVQVSQPVELDGSLLDIRVSNLRNRFLTFTFSMFGYGLAVALLVHLSSLDGSGSASSLDLTASLGACAVLATLVAAIKIAALQQVSSEGKRPHWQEFRQRWYQTLSLLIATFGTILGWYGLLTTNDHIEGFVVWSTSNLVVAFAVESALTLGESELGGALTLAREQYVRTQVQPRLATPADGEASALKALLFAVLWVAPAMVGSGALTLIFEDQNQYVSAAAVGISTGLAMSTAFYVAIRGRYFWFIRDWASLTMVVIMGVFVTFVVLAWPMEYGPQSLVNGLCPLMLGLLVCGLSVWWHPRSLRFVPRRLDSLLRRWDSDFTQQQKFRTIPQRTWQALSDWCTKSVGAESLRKHQKLIRKVAALDDESVLSMKSLRTALQVLDQASQKGFQEPRSTPNG